MKKGMWVAWCVGLLGLWGCGGPVISTELRQEAAPITGLAEVRQNPEGFKNRTVIVGGEILHTLNRANETTTLVVLDYPLGRRERPDESAQSQGRFLADVSQFLDPEVYGRGRRVTVAGVVEGVKIAPVGKTEYRYVVVKARQVYLWPREQYVPAYAYPYPYWDYGVWGPPWWGPGFGGGDEGFGGEGRGEEGEHGGEGGEHGGEGGRR